jgi:hypothetical protein
MAVFSLWNVIHNFIPLFATLFVDLTCSVCTFQTSRLLNNLLLFNYNAKLTKYDIQVSLDFSKCRNKLFVWKHLYHAQGPRKHLKSGGGGTIKKGHRAPVTPPPILRAHA